MNPRKTQAATEAAAGVAMPNQLYRHYPAKSSILNEILARLLFAMESPHTNHRERHAVLRVIDGLIRLKVDRGLLKEVHHVQ